MGLDDVRREGIKDGADECWRESCAWFEGNLVVIVIVGGEWGLVLLGFVFAFALLFLEFWGWWLGILLKFYMFLQTFGFYCLRLLGNP